MVLLLQYTLIFASVLILHAALQFFLELRVELLVGDGS